MKKHIKILLGVLSIIVVFYMSAKKSTKEGLILKVNKVYPQNQNVSSFCPPGQKLIKHACGSGAEQAMRSGQKPQYGPYNYDAMLQGRGHCSTSCNCHNVWMQCGVGGGGGGGAVGGINYSPMKRNEVKNRTYIGPSPEDKRKCEQRGRGHLPCGDPQADRCIRSVASCKSLGGCGSHPSHCGTCMERNYNPIQNCLQQSGIHCSKCGSGTELSSDRTKCIQKAPAPPVLAPRYVKPMMKVGLPGDSGPRGQKGPIGLRGLQGSKGAPAKPIQAGWLGPKGAKGIGGAKGPKGLKGNRGSLGDMGIKGYRGPNTIYDPWVDNKVVDQLKKIKDKLSEKTNQLEKKSSAQKKPIDIKIKIPRKRSYAVQQKFLLEEEKIEPFSVYPPGRGKEELSTLKAY